MSADTVVLAILLGGMAGKCIAMLMNARDARKREQDRKRLEAVMPPATSAFYPWNRQGRRVTTACKRSRSSQPRQRLTTPNQQDMRGPDGCEQVYPRA